MITLKTLFLLFVAFYVTVKIAFFVSVWFITGAIARRALQEKEKRAESLRLQELEAKLEAYEQQTRNVANDKVIYGTRHKRFVA
ncbi:MAG: hypothetical protein HPY81_01155 [Firmicutes bacterium]|nr:hypothetical protein [Bacillota bacterium]